MRNGILLAEDSPENIMKVFKTVTLEDAFLILSQKQGQSEEADNTLQKAITESLPTASTAAGTAVDAAVVAVTMTDSTTASGQKTGTPAILAAVPAASGTPVEPQHTTPKMEVEYLAGQEQYLRRNMSFAEQKAPGFLSKLQFTSTTRMKALLTKNVLQLIRQPS